MTPSSRPASRKSLIPCLVALSLCLSCATKSESPVVDSSGAPAKVLDCKPADQFITTLVFLRDNESFKVGEAEARSIAFDVAAGCTGSAGRFIEIAEVLTKAKLDTASALRIAREFSHRDAASAKAFKTVFIYAFAKEYLDLDLKSAVAIAERLASEPFPAAAVVAEDYRELVRYCIDNQQLALARPQCAALAARITLLGKDFNAPIAAAFVESMEFLTAADGPKLTTADAIALAEVLLANSPNAHESFKQTYSFASAKSGLNLGRDEAVVMAKRVALVTAMAVTVKPQNRPL